MIRLFILLNNLNSEDLSIIRLAFIEQNFTYYLSRKFINPYQIKLAYFRDYVHVNWGWNGSDNGFYLSGIFNCADKRYVIPSYGNKSMHNYKYQLSIYPYIKL
ncbi:MAG: C10 family peptidase [Bacteroidales bacterium]|nr:C10 family peptidase [Bacteroidales bacterium]